LLWILIDVPTAMIVVSPLKEMALSVVVIVEERFIQNAPDAVEPISIMKVVVGDVSNVTTNGKGTAPPSRN